MTPGWDAKYLAGLSLIYAARGYLVIAHCEDLPALTPGDVITPTFRYGDDGLPGTQGSIPLRIVAETTADDWQAQEQILGQPLHVLPPGYGRFYRVEGD